MKDKTVYINSLVSTSRKLTGKTYELMLAHIIKMSIGTWSIISSHFAVSVFALMASFNAKKMMLVATPRALRTKFG